MILEEELVAGEGLVVAAGAPGGGGDVGEGDQVGEQWFGAAVGEEAQKVAFDFIQLFIRLLEDVDGLGAVGVGDDEVPGLNSLDRGDRVAFGFDDQEANGGVAEDEIGGAVGGAGAGGGDVEEGGGVGTVGLEDAEQEAGFGVIFEQVFAKDAGFGGGDLLG